MRPDPVAPCSRTRGDFSEVTAKDPAEHVSSSLRALVAGAPARVGFSSARVTGRTGDSGIDGLGVYQLSLLSFLVFFQCKRYSGSVGASAVRDFRGATAGRGDKGLLIAKGPVQRWRAFSLAEWIAFGSGRGIGTERGTRG
jgi:restriction endonuclease Mrr